MYAHITHILHVRWQNIGNFVLYEFLRVIICITMHSNGLSRIFHFMSWLYIVYLKQFVCCSKNIVQYYNFNCNICKFASILRRNVSQSFMKLLQFSLNFFSNFSSKHPLFAMFSVFQQLLLPTQLEILFYFVFWSYHLECLQNRLQNRFFIQIFRISFPSIIIRKSISYKFMEINHLFVVNKR